jgi:RNA polymerase sigma-70 factor (ECF subfamily)
MSLEYNDFTDNELLEECAKDNTKAFDILFKRYSGKLYNYGMYYIKDCHFAEEAMMDLMCWIWEKRHTLQIQGEFQHYVFRAMKNATLKSIRNRFSATDPVESIENSASLQTISADHRIQTMEMQSMYNQKLNLLSPQRKLVFQMSRENDLTHAEIASRLKISLNTVKNHIKFSLSHFRKLLPDTSDSLS